MPLFVGTYTKQSDSLGIYRFSFEETTGSLSDCTLVAKTKNPSFLAVDTAQKRLVCVNETLQYNGEPTGAISCYKIKENNFLQLTSQGSSGGKDPCYIAFSKDLVFVANYHDGAVSMQRLDEKGVFELLAVKKHHGSGPHRTRQESAHAHSVTPLPGNRIAVTDLGTDKIIIYNLSPKDFSRQFSVHEAPGSGPRHMTISPCGTRIFVLNELNSTLSLYTYLKKSGVMEKIISLSTLPPDWQGENSPADIHIAEDGQYIYCSNRGHDSLAVFQYTASNDSLSCIQVIKSGGKHPRNFALSPNGQFLLCANQHSNNIVTFAVIPESGQLQYTDKEVTIPAPACLTWINTEQKKAPNPKMT